MNKLTFTIAFLAILGIASAQEYLNEDFESANLPAGWEIITSSTDGGYLFGVSDQLSSESWPIVDNGSNIVVSNDDACNCNKSDDRLITPSINLSSATNAFLKFDYIFLAYGLESFEVQYSVDGGINWEILDQLSESTIPGAGNNWVTYTLYLGDVIGNEDVKFSFIYHDGSDWGYGLALDNVLIYNPETKTDVKITSVEMSKNHRLNEEVIVKGEYENVGTDTLNSVIVNWTDGVLNYSQTYSELKLAPFRKTSFEHDVKFSSAIQGNFNLAISLENPNGLTDVDVSNNTIIEELVIWNDFVERTVLIEEFSTEKCPQCPPVGLYLSGLAHDNENLILMVHHAGYYTDPYTIPENEQMLAFYKAGRSTYAPAGMMDRHYNGLDNDENEGVDPGPVFWPGDPFGERRISQRFDEISMLDVHISGLFNMETRTIQVTVSGKFMSDFEQSLGTSLWIIEDGIISKKQAGYAGDWTHHALVRDAISETFGDEIVSDTKENNTYSKTYTYTIDPTWESTNLSLVAFINDMDATKVNNRSVQNSVSIKLSELELTEEILISVPNKNFNAVTFYPNPFNNTITIKNVDIASQIMFHDVLGKIVLNSIAIEEDVTIETSALERGIYIVTISDNKGNLRTEKIIKQ